jgi:hypothetical protein
MNQSLPNTAFLPAPDDVIAQFINLLEFLFLSSSEKEISWRADYPWFLHGPDGIISDIKNQGWGADLEPVASFQFVIEKGLGQRLPIVCLLRAQHPLTFVFRLYCQKHGSLIENWIESCATEREFAELQTFVSEMRNSEMRFGQVESQAEWVQALAHLVDHDFSGIIWCDWKLTKEERAVFVEMTKRKKIQMVEQAPVKPFSQSIQGGSIKVILLATDKSTAEFLRDELEHTLCRAFGKGNYELINLNSIPDVLTHLLIFNVRMLVMDMKELGVVTKRKVQSINTELVATIKRHNPTVQLIALIDELEDSEEDPLMLKRAGIDSTANILFSHEMALKLRHAFKSHTLALNV